MENQEVLILALVAAVTPLFIFFVKAMYKSKCTDVSCCCGLLTCKRNVEIESANIDDIDIKKNLPNKKSTVLSKTSQDGQTTGEDLI